MSWAVIKNNWWKENINCITENARRVLTFAAPGNTQWFQSWKLSTSYSLTPQSLLEATKWVAPLQKFPCQAMLQSKRQIIQYNNYSWHKKYLKLSYISIAFVRALSSCVTLVQKVTPFLSKNCIHYRHYKLHPI